MTTRKDWTSDQEVRWCPGCGDYSILAAVQMLMPDLGVRRENTVFVSGIGCAARFPYYMNTYGMHSIHGRAPAIATGLAVTRPDLDVWVITGDGDALSIGGNHLIHALRRNVNITILLFNNQIYGLTKGQYSPTSELGKVTKSTPFGSLDTPFNPVSLALGAEASFVARTHDMDRKHMQEMFRRAHDHNGAAFVEIYQNCNVFNDGAFEKITGRTSAADADPPGPRRAHPLRGRAASTGVVMRVRRPPARSSRWPTWARTPSSSTTSAATTRAWPSPVPAGPRALRAHAHRRLPGRGAPRVRGRDGPAAPRGQRAPGPRRPRRPAGLGLGPGRSRADPAALGAAPPAPVAGARPDARVAGASVGATFSTTWRSADTSVGTAPSRPPIPRRACRRHGKAGRDP